ncbi:hypothetical protein [Algicella marina]|uniref:Uncharacterized protein n=1 Tax=Algicella marina TaxID=2683284 RepID=A0A6P1T204_9RHOB|nr:hypothetical protein [Algicella marina]QHQ35486.1 hypothetical protein GO499_09935 [Algicella marina]
MSDVRDEQKTNEASDAPSRFTAQERSDYRVALKRLAMAELPSHPATVGSLEENGLLF